MESRNQNLKAHSRSNGLYNFTVTSMGIWAVGSERKIFLNHNVTRSQAPPHHNGCSGAKPQKQNWSGPSVPMVRINKELPTRYNSPSSPPINLFSSPDRSTTSCHPRMGTTCHPIPRIPKSLRFRQAQVAETTRAKTSPLGPRWTSRNSQSKSQEGSFKIYPTWGFKLIFYLIPK